MKKSILATDIATSNMLYLNTITSATKKDDIDHEIRQVYTWSIETELGTFTGTCLSIDGVNEEIALLTNGARILKKNIVPVSLINENLENKVYTWNIMTNSGYASGVSVSLEEAKRVMNSFGSTDVIKSNIIESFTSK